MTHRSRRNRLLLTSAMFAVIALGGGGAMAADQTFQFDIPAESLGQALTDFSRVSSEQIVFSEDAVTGKKSSGLHGRYSAPDALNALLVGSDLRVAVGANGVMMVQPKKAQAASNEGAADANTLETVTVTGTHLRDAESLTPITTITSADLEHQGYTTLSEALYQLPENSKGGVSPESGGPGGVAGPNNTNFASGVNLRGLGPNDTLVLLNGQRLPSTAYGTTVDISGLPVSAIERVEILDDGASAIYGSDAVAGVVNIITKKDFDGIETGVHMDNVADGKEPDLGGYLLGGFNWGTGNALFDYNYESQKPLLASARSFTNTEPSPFYLLPEQQITTLYGSANQQLGSHVLLSGSINYSYRPFSSDNNLGFSVISSQGVSRQLSANGELDYNLNTDWRFSLIGVLGNERDTNDSCYVSFGECLPATLRYSDNSVEANGTGTLFSLPGGDVNVAFGLGDRAETFHIAFDTCTPACVFTSSGGGNRNDFSAYAEALIPIIGPDNGIPLVKQLRIDAAVRYDRYSDFGGTTNPKVALQWVPADSLSLHGSYSTSFKAPTLDQLYGDSTLAGYIYYADPANPGAGNALEIDQDANPSLRPETATNFNAGLSYEPEFIPGLKIDSSYFNIDYKNKVVHLGDTFLFTDVFNGQLGNYVNTNPTSSQIASALALVNTPPNIGTYCYVSNCSPSTIKAIANIGIVNAASVQLDGLDFNGHYDIDTAFGRFNLDAAATYYLSYSEGITPTATPAPGSGIVYTPVRFRGKFNVGWFNGPWTANARLNYVGSERNQYDTSCSLAGCPVSSWTTVDLSASYSFQDIAAAPYLNGFRVNLGVSNVFDRAPPYANLSGKDYDAINTNPLGRVFSLALTKRW